MKKPAGERPPSQAEVDLLIEETDRWLTGVEKALRELGYEIPEAKDAD